MWLISSWEKNNCCYLMAHQLTEPSFLPKEDSFQLRPASWTNIPSHKKQSSIENISNFEMKYITNKLIVDCPKVDLHETTKFQSLPLSYCMVLKTLWSRTDLKWSIRCGLIFYLYIKYKLFYTYLICQFNFEARLTIPGILRPHSYSAKLAILEFS